MGSKHQALDKVCGGIVFIIDTSASMLNGDYAPTRWEVQKTVIQSICNAVLCGSTERKLQPSFGLIHSNSGRTGFSMLPCRANYLDLMKEVDNLSFAQEESIDISKSLKLLKLSLKNRNEKAPRVVIITSSLPTEAEDLVEVAEKVARIDCIYLGGDGNPNSNAKDAENPMMEGFCAEHGCGKLVCLKPFDSLMHAWQWQEDLLSKLSISQKDSVLYFEPKETSRSSRLFSTGSGMRGRSSMRINMTESCRGESLDSYQHLSSDGMCKSWLPSYATLAKKYKEKGLPQHYYLAILDSLCKWQTVFSCKAGRMVSVEKNSKGGKRLLDPVKKQGVLKLLYSADAESWCMQWKENEGVDVHGLPPLTCQKELKEDSFSVRFTGPSKVKFEAVPCSTGEVLGIHLVSTLYKRQPSFFWLQEEFTCEHGKGASGLVRKLQDIICTKVDEKETSPEKQPLLIKSLGMASDKLHLETVILNLVSSASSKYYPSSQAGRGKRENVSTSTSTTKEKEIVPKENESDLDKGFYSWMHTAQLDSELSEDPNLAAQIQTSSHTIGKTPSSTAAQGTEVKTDKEDSLLFELD